MIPRIVKIDLSKLLPAADATTSFVMNKRKL
ncbi:uncharacterized protein METZ01_LOCUS327481 [marine metagenome]|uniref:Uncharacterized protein n=1 Tax=marine metagenome TaxID=408172 RepID=A0A382PP68_9ZZZZ